MGLTTSGDGGGGSLDASSLMNENFLSSLGANAGNGFVTIDLVPPP